MQILISSSRDETIKHQQSDNLTSFKPTVITIELIVMACDYVYAIAAVVADKKNAYSTRDDLPFRFLHFVWLPQATMRHTFESMACLMDAPTKD